MGVLNSSFAPNFPQNRGFSPKLWSHDAVTFNRLHFAVVSCTKGILEVVAPDAVTTGPHAYLDDNFWTKTNIFNNLLTAKNLGERQLPHLPRPLPPS